MNTTLLDCSKRPELLLHAQTLAAVGSVAEALGVKTLIAGAFARDLHTMYAHDLPAERRTEDLDIALAVASWGVFQTLRDRLIGSGSFLTTPRLHRLRHIGELSVDLIPFGGVETRHRHIHWPPGGESRMDVFGFQEALASATVVLLPDAVQARVASVPALVLLKLAAWQDRHHRSPRKDGQDLWLLIANYLQLGNEQRLWGEFVAWTDEERFDYEEAGARMVGTDLARLLDAEGRRKILAILGDQTRDEVPGLLPVEMNPTQPKRARTLLASVLRGLAEQH